VGVLQLNELIVEVFRKQTAFGEMKMKRKKKKETWRSLLIKMLQAVNADVSATF
jgi:hypothetical protein